jgi:hypothetical protein
MGLLPRATLHSDSEHLLIIKVFYIFGRPFCNILIFFSLACRIDMTLNVLMQNKKETAGIYVHYNFSRMGFTENLQKLSILNMIIY